jgi:multicomponent K+:H+ antiporter subunit E
MPYPWLFAGLCIMWLLLGQSISPGQIVLAILVSFAVVHATAAIKPYKARVHHPALMVRLGFFVLVDIIRSNFAVMKIVLFPGGKRVSGFVRFPLDLEDKFGLTVLALIITATPGTMWVEYNRTRSELLVHVLDLIDEDEWVHLIKARYETLLVRIFCA